MRAFKSLMSSTKNLLRMMRRDQDQVRNGIVRKAPFSEKISKHRNIMKLYDLSPQIGSDTFIAPNATVIGEVQIGFETNIWYGCVIRGDINGVKIGSNTSVGENTVIHTAASLPTGLPAAVEIGENVIVQSNCTLYSCKINDGCLIGHKTVILEGAIVERDSIIGPNSVIPPGRIIPAQQLWAGNPVEYIRDLTKAEIQSVRHEALSAAALGEDHEYEFSLPRSAYLQKENTEEDLNVDVTEPVSYTHLTLPTIYSV
eukprot:TRINITY_DN2391_c0_g1_i1.p1 TRINITY_DN2391_c0_g1~~TRINITY_DN2391_c0_g1_i1.p1  ORF type:complete len:257 (-),score=55.10 TRINITY_DN2391_c0_g1_i1:37-807(-)